MTFEPRRETYEPAAFPLGLRVSWRDPELRHRMTGYINGYWGGVGGNPVTLLYGVVPDNADDAQSIWLHHHQVHPQ